MRTPILLACAALTLVASTAEAAGSRSGSRSVQGRFGHGYVASGSVNWGDGAITRQGQRTFNNGKSQSGWRTLYRTDDGYARSFGASGSGGRSVTGGRDVSFGDDSITVDRSLTTGAGETYSRSRTWPRPD